MRTRLALSVGPVTRGQTRSVNPGFTTDSLQPWELLSLPEPQGLSGTLGS